MFTGIIEEIGKVLSITSNKITVECETVIRETKIGDSIAVNGVCLTVTNLWDNKFEANISPETFRVTSLNTLQHGDLVNLERAMLLNGRFGGHIVQGHIDNTGKCLAIKKESDFYNLKIELNSQDARYVIKKGSIAINGISLTVAEINDNIINLAIIPHTFEHTNLKTLKSNDFVNIEVDITAKYIEKFLSTSDNKTRISLEFLQEHGF